MGVLGLFWLITLYEKTLLSSFFCLRLNPSFILKKEGITDLRWRPLTVVTRHTTDTCSLRFIDKGFGGRYSDVCKETKIWY